MSKTGDNVLNEYRPLRYDIQNVSADVGKVKIFILLPLIIFSFNGRLHSVPNLKHASSDTYYLHYMGERLFLSHL